MQIHLHVCRMMRCTACLHRIHGIGPTMWQPHDAVSRLWALVETLGSELIRILQAGFLRLSVPGADQECHGRSNCVSFALSELLEFRSLAGHLTVAIYSRSPRAASLIWRLSITPCSAISRHASESKEALLLNRLSPTTARLWHRRRSGILCINTVPCLPCLVQMPCAGLEIRTSSRHRDAKPCLSRFAVRCEVPLGHGP